MLGNHPVDVVLLAVDLQVSRRFYADQVGLDVVDEDEHRVIFRCGGDSRLAISQSTVGTKDEQTQAMWRVSDIASEVAELRARGVVIEEYDTPGLKTENGIADVPGFGRAAWFIDPGGNAVGLMEPARP